MQLVKSGVPATSANGRRNARGQSAVAVAPTASVSGRCMPEALVETVSTLLTRNLWRK